MLYIFGGLPGTGKTQISRMLAESISANYLRIDSIEQSLKDSGHKKLWDEGYKIAMAIALDNLKNGTSVVADSTNPVAQSRQAWRDVAKSCQLPYVEIEIVCSDIQTHKNRVENRFSDIKNLALPSWNNVVSRHYEPWTSANIVIDTANKTPKQCLIELTRRLSVQADK